MKQSKHLNRFAALRRRLSLCRFRKCLWLMPGLLAGCLLAGSQLLAARYVPHAMPLPQTLIRVGGQPVTVEIARTAAARAYGLMNRKALPAGHGMLFVFRSAQPVTFWMQHTLIPLDILYFGNDGILQTILPDRPPCRIAVCPEYPSVGTVRYALEINAGEAARLRLKTGDRLQFQDRGR